jgi:hypothetical protein
MQQKNSKTRKRKTANEGNFLKSPSGAIVPRVSVEQIETWAEIVVRDSDSDKQLAFVALLREIALLAGEHLDVEDTVSTALYAAFRKSDGLHDEAIDLIAGVAQQDLAPDHEPINNSDDDDCVTVTLPNGKEVELGGDAADLAREDPDPVLAAVFELLHNPETPQDLYEAVAGFVCEQSSQCGDNFYHSTPMLAAVLNTVSPDETRGAALSAREGGVQ